MGLTHFVRRIWRHPANRGRRLSALARAAWWELRGRPTADVTLPGGMRVRCYADSGVAMGLVYYGGRPEYHEMGLVEHLLRPGDRFIDVGANVGYFTLLAAACVGPGGAVEALEPGTLALTRLRENLAVNGLTNVRVHALAAADSPGTVRFIDTRDTENRIAVASDPVAGTVPAARLDGLFAETTFALGKIDVEGAELLVLRGAENLLTRANPPVWIIEAGKRLKTYGATEEELAKWLDARGFDLGSYDADAREFRFGSTPWIGRENVVAVARSAREEIERRVANRGASSQPDRR